MKVLTDRTAAALVRLLRERPALPTRRARIFHDGDSGFEPPPFWVVDRVIDDEHHCLVHPGMAYGLHTHVTWAGGLVARDPNMQYSSTSDGYYDLGVWGGYGTNHVYLVVSAPTDFNDLDAKTDATWTLQVRTLAPTYGFATRGSWIMLASLANGVFRRHWRGGPVSFGGAVGSFTGVSEVKIQGSKLIVKYAEWTGKGMLGFSRTVVETKEFNLPSST